MWGEQVARYAGFSSTNLSGDVTTNQLPNEWLGHGQESLRPDIWKRSVRAAIKTSGIQTQIRLNRLDVPGASNDNAPRVAS